MLPHQPIRLGNGNVKPNLASALVTILAQVSKICAPVASIRPQVTPVMMSVARLGFYVSPVFPEFLRRFARFLVLTIVANVGSTILGIASQVASVRTNVPSVRLDVSPV